MKSQGQKGVTLVELLVAVAIASILILGIVAAFQTTQRSAAIGEAREQIYQNARVALDIVAREIKNAYIDNRSRDFIFISADGLAGRGNSIIEFYPNPPASPTDITYRGLGNAQTPHGIDPTGAEVFELYADSGFGVPTYTTLTIKAINDIYTLSPGPPDRLDFTCLTSFFPGNTNNQSRLAEVRYSVTTETFIDDLDNDLANGADENDDDPPGAGLGLTGLGDLIPMGHRDDFHPETRKIKGLSLFQLSRGLDITPDKNPFSVNDMQTSGEMPAGTTQGRYPARDFADFESSNNGENIGSYIYDLQFEFYGKIAVSLDSNGQPNTWGAGWGYQDVRGEDTGLIDDNANDDGEGPLAIDYGTVASNLSANGNDDDGDGQTDDFSGIYATPESNRTNGLDDDGDTIPDDGPESPYGRPESFCMLGTSTTWNSLPKIGGGTVDLVGGMFFVLPSGSDENTVFDAADPNSDVYRIIEVVSDTVLVLNREYAGTAVSGAYYRIIEPTQANGILDNTGTVTNPVYPEDLGADGIVDDPLDNMKDDGTYNATATNIPSNVSDNDGTTSETSVGEGNKRLDSRVMGIWDSRSPDPRNPRMASELDGADSDGDASTLQTNTDGGTPIDDDGDGFANTDDDEAGVDDAATPESDNIGTTVDETNDLEDDDSDNMVDDRFYEPAGKPEGIDEPDEADPDDDTLPKAVRITIAVSDPQQTLEPVVLSTTVWLSTAR